MKKTILLTGASGFIGKNILEKLNSSYTFLSPRHIELNLLDEQAVDKFFSSHSIDIVIHAAVVGGSRKEEYENNMLEQNLRMFFNIVKNKKKFKKMINFGSGAEYDKSKPIRKIKEVDFGKSIPKDEYGFFKYICSKYIEGIDNIVSLRIFGLFGKYEDYRYRFISNAILDHINGKGILINQNVYFDYLYIDDFIKIVDYFIKNNTKEKFYNIGTGQTIDLKTIALKINKLTRSQASISIKSPGLNKEYSCNNSRLLKELKNFPLTNIDTAILELYEWYKKNF